MKIINLQFITKFSVKSNITDRLNILQIVNQSTRVASRRVSLPPFQNFRVARDRCEFSIDRPQARRSVQKKKKKRKKRNGGLFPGAVLQFLAQVLTTKKGCGSRERLRQHLVPSRVGLSCAMVAETIGSEPRSWRPVGVIPFSTTTASITCSLLSLVHLANLLGTRPSGKGTEKETQRLTSAISSLSFPFFSRFFCSSGRDYREEPEERGEEREEKEWILSRGGGATSVSRNKPHETRRI